MTCQEHPLDRQEVRREIVDWMRRTLGQNAGTGRAIVEFDWKDGRPLSWRGTFEGARKPLTEACRRP